MLWALPKSGHNQGALEWSGKKPFVQVFWTVFEYLFSWQGSRHWLREGWSTCLGRVFGPPRLPGFLDVTGNTSAAHRGGSHLAVVREKRSRGTRRVQHNSLLFDFDIVQGFYVAERAIFFADLLFILERHRSRSSICNAFQYVFWVCIVFSVAKEIRGISFNRSLPGRI